MSTVPASHWLPDIPKVVNWATALLILGAIPWLLVFVDDILSASTVMSGTDFPLNRYGALLLFSIGYLGLIVSLLNGRRRTRITTVVVTVVFNLFLLNGVVGLARYLGWPEVGPEVGVVRFELLILAWTAVLSGVGLVLLCTPASSTYIARSEEYQAYLDQRTLTDSSR